MLLLDCPLPLLHPYTLLIFRELKTTTFCIVLITWSFLVRHLTNGEVWRSRFYFPSTSVAYWRLIKTYVRYFVCQIFKFLWTSKYFISLQDWLVITIWSLDKKWYQETIINNTEQKSEYVKIFSFCDVSSNSWIPPKELRKYLHYKSVCYSWVVKISLLNTLNKSRFVRFYDEPFRITRADWTFSRS